VQNLHRDILEVSKQLTHEKNTILVLQAEWTYLNQPSRLNKLAKKYTQLAPIKLAKIYKADKELPLYLAEDEKIKYTHLASRDLAKERKRNEHNAAAKDQAILKVRAMKNHHHLTNVNY
jgi:hypothetical protein